MTVKQHDLRWTHWNGWLQNESEDGLENDMFHRNISADSHCIRRFFYGFAKKSITSGDAIQHACAGAARHSCNPDADSDADAGGRDDWKSDGMDG